MIRSRRRRMSGLDEERVVVVVVVVGLTSRARYVWMVLS